MTKSQSSEPVIEIRRAQDADIFTDSAWQTTLAEAKSYFNASSTNFGKLETVSARVNKYLGGYDKTMGALQRDISELEKQLKTASESKKDELQCQISELTKQVEDINSLPPKPSDTIPVDKKKATRAPACKEQAFGAHLALNAEGVRQEYKHGMVLDMSKTSPNLSGLGHAYLEVSFKNGRDGILDSSRGECFYVDQKLDSKFNVPSLPNSHFVKSKDGTIFNYVTLNDSDFNNPDLIKEIELTRQLAVQNTSNKNPFPNSKSELIELRMKKFLELKLWEDSTEGKYCRETLQLAMGELYSGNIDGVFGKKSKAAFNELLEKYPNSTLPEILSEQAKSMKADTSQNKLSACLEQFEARKAEGAQLTANMLPTPQNTANISLT